MTDQTSTEAAAAAAAAQVYPQEAEQPPAAGSRPPARRAFSSLRPVNEPESLPAWLKAIDARLARIERVLGIES